MSGEYKYIDFAIEIDAEGRGRVLHAVGLEEEVWAAPAFPISRLELENKVQAVQIANLQARGGGRRLLSPAQAELQALGQALFAFLFPRQVLALYDRCRHEASRQEKGVRLKLTLADPALARLPWEYLYDSRQGEFVALSRNAPVVRYLPVDSPERPLAAPAPLRILGMVASPADLPPLHVEQERDRVDAALAPLQDQGVAELVWLEGSAWRDLLAAMRRGPWHVLHFIGHGAFDPSQDEGMLLLEDADGLAAPLHAGELARLVADHPSLRLVFLNVCEGATGSDTDAFASAAAALVRRGTPAVLAMQYEISDGAAIEFARTFYDAVADGLPVDAAVTDARKAVSLAAPNSPAWGAPVLFMQAADGVLFTLEEPVQGRLSPVGRPAEPSKGLGWRSFWPALPLLVVLVLLGVLAQRWRSPEPGAGQRDVVENGSAGDLPVLLRSSLDSLEAISGPEVGVGGFAVLDEAQFVPGVRGQAIYFNGRGPYVRFPVEQETRRNLSLEAGALELYYRPDFSYPGAPPQRDNHTLFVVGDLYNPPQLLLNVGSRVQLTYAADWEDVYFAAGESAGLWEPGEWIKVRAEWDRNDPQDPLRIFINDQRIDVERTGGVWPLPTDKQQMSGLFVGAGNANGDHDVAGAIDELTVWGRQ